MERPTPPVPPTGTPVIVEAGGVSGAIKATCSHILLANRMKHEMSRYGAVEQSGLTIMLWVVQNYSFEDVLAYLTDFAPYATALHEEEMKQREAQEERESQRLKEYLRRSGITRDPDEADSPEAMAAELDSIMPLDPPSPDLWVNRVNRTPTKPVPWWKKLFNQED